MLEQYWHHFNQVLAFTAMIGALGAYMTVSVYVGACFVYLLHRAKDFHEVTGRYLLITLAVYWIYFLFTFPLIVWLACYLGKKSGAF